MLAKINDSLSLFFSKSWSFLRPRKKLGIISFIILTSLGITVWFATTNVVWGFVGELLGDLGGAILTAITWVIMWMSEWLVSLSIFLLRFVIEMAGYNGYIDSRAVMVGWVMVRDITNMFFVIVLLIIAFTTILGIEGYEWKKLLMKLIFAAVIVNFSRIICGLIIDAAQVVMITFINGVAATAGGNLINMWKLDQLMKFSGEVQASKLTDGSKFIAAVGALTFSAMLATTMLVYTIMLLARMVYLWILIVLSPLAFVLNVIPQTQKYSGEWWNEFSGNVIAGPVIAFFLWLSFVTLGTGDVHDDILKGTDSLPPGAKIDSNYNPNFGAQSSGVTSVMTWANMANLAIAMGMLMAGAKMAQKLGAAGGSMMGKVGEIGKKVAMTASGLRAGQWAAKGAWGGVKKGTKWGLMKAPLVGGEAWQRRGRAIKAEVSKAWTKGWVEPRVIKAGEHMEKAYGRKKVDLENLGKHTQHLLL